MMTGITPFSVREIKVLDINYYSGWVKYQLVISQYTPTSPMVGAVKKALGMPPFKVVKEFKDVRYGYLPVSVQSYFKDKQSVAQFICTKHLQVFTDESID